MCTASNWTFRPFVSSSPSLIRRFLLIFLLIQLKPKHHRLAVLTIFQRGVRGAVFRDTLPGPRRESIASISIVETCKKYGHDICRENSKKKRPRNLLNKIQNVFINGKQVKSDKITQIIP